MSRIGKKPIEIPGGVTVTLDGRTVTCQGKLGTLSYAHRPEVAVNIDEQAKQIVIDADDNNREARAFHGMTRALIQNMVIGVSQGYTRELDIHGVGWGAKVAGQNLEMNLGYADTRVVAIPAGVNVEVRGQRIFVSGIDKQAVGQFAATARAQRKPEPYNGRGVKYVEEVIVRKEGKAFAGGG